MATFLKKEKRVLLLEIMMVLFFLLGVNLAASPQITGQEIVNALQQTVIQASDKVAPAVVNIRIVQLTYDSFFNVVPQEGQGSGVIFSKEGYILTNEHVISNAREIKIVLPDGRELEAEVIGADPLNDLAIVKIKTENLPLAKLGDSDKLKPGEFCIAIGNPFGLQNTITFGVISALGRNIGVDPERILENLIQTDAPINPGNSGGPLINLAGEVIGINNSIIPYAQGIGFAVPINTAKEIIDELIEHGRVIRPWLGIYSLCVTPQVKERFNLSVDSGCYIVKVVPQSPAEKGKIKEGDVIVRVDNQTINTVEDLQKIMKTRKVGQEITITIIRENKHIEIRVKLAEMPQG
jgi:serine protease Do